MSATNKVTDNRRCACDQASFLANKANRKQFINLLSQYLTDKDRAVKLADTILVRVAVNFAGNRQTATVILEDCDVIVLHLYHCQKDNLHQKPTHLNMYNIHTKHTTTFIHGHFFHSPK